MSCHRCYFSVITANYMCYVVALEKQIRHYEPNATFFALVVDRIESESDFNNLPFDIHYLEDYVEKDWFRKATYFYNPFEIANASKAMAHRIASTVYNASEWAYIDSDIYVCGALDALWEQAGDIILTSHCNTVESGQKAREAELSFLRFGGANGGIVACRKSPSAELFVKWFEECSLYSCFDEWRSTYVDQKWLDLVPAQFANVTFCRHPGVNVGHWNFHERKMKIASDGSIFVNNQPLLAFHFSKWSPVKWEAVPMDYDFIDQNSWLQVASAYKDLLFTSGWETYRKLPYRFATDAKGRRITKEMRRAYFLFKATIPDPWTMKSVIMRLTARQLMKSWFSSSCLCIAGALRLFGLRK